MRRALITGISGQDGSYLAEFLLAKGYEVHGIVRRCSTFNTVRIDPVFDQLKLHHGDVTDDLSLLKTLLQVRPHEVYNLAAQSHVGVSFKQPVYTAESAGVGAARVFEACRILQDTTGEQVRIYQASSSEMFGNSPAPQNESTPFRPVSPYACAKVYAHNAAVTYREAHGMHLSCGILFNHESPRRGPTFVTRKITLAAGRIKHGLQEVVALGNLDAHRDWGFAGDYVEAMWLMLQQEQPDDFVIGTGETRSVREFGEEVFAILNMEFTDKAVFDPKYLRPHEVNCLQADPSKALNRLGWAPRHGFHWLVMKMTVDDSELARKEVLCLT